MLFRKLIVSAALAAAAAVPTASYAAPVQKAPCILSEHKVISVVPYTVDEHSGRNIYQRLRGAQVFIQAEPGMSREWLQLNLERHLAALTGPAAMPDCAFDIDNVRLDVTAAGSGYWVRLIAPDTKSGEEVLRRAQLLLN
jgi:hypothetical protein